MGEGQSKEGETAGQPPHEGVKTDESLSPGERGCALRLTGVLAHLALVPPQRNALLPSRSRASSRRLIFRCGR